MGGLPFRGLCERVGVEDVRTTCRKSRKIRRGLEWQTIPKGLRRIHGGGNWHFITYSCYRRQQFFSSARRKDFFLRILEEVRAKHNFTVGGYVVMLEHFHLLISEPAHGTLSLTMQVLKQRVSRGCRKKQRQRQQMNLWAKDLRSAFWQRRYYDFNVYSQRLQPAQIH